MLHLNRYFIYLFIYIRKEPKLLGPLNFFKTPCNLFLSFFSQIFLPWAAQGTQEKKFERYYQEFSFLIPQHPGDLDLMSFEPKTTQLI